jgi:uncharacterized protein
VSTRELPLFPLNVVLFPGMPLPLHIFEERYRMMIGTCMVTEEAFGVALIRSGQEVGGPAEIYPVGTTAEILQIDRLPDGRMNLLAHGVDRFRIVEQLEGQPYAVGRVELLAEAEEQIVQGLQERVGRLLRRYLVSKGMRSEQVEELCLPRDAAGLAYLVAATLTVPNRKKQQLLEDDSVTSRLRRELAILEWSTGGPGEANARSFSVN